MKELFVHKCDNFVLSLLFLGVFVASYYQSAIF